MRRTKNLQTFSDPYQQQQRRQQQPADDSAGVSWTQGRQGQICGLWLESLQLSSLSAKTTSSTLPLTRTGNFAQCRSKALYKPDCLVAMPNITFRTGRTDCDACAAPYIATKTKVHPSAFVNGQTTLEWLETNFGYNDAKALSKGPDGGSHPGQAKPKELTVKVHMDAGQSFILQQPV